MAGAIRDWPIRSIINENKNNLKNLFYKVYTVKYRFMESSLLLDSPLYLEISIPTDIQSIELSYRATR